MLLKRFRAAAGLTQEELAKEAELSVETIGKIERGERRRLHPGTLRRLATGLKLSAADRALLLNAVAEQSNGFAPPAAAAPVAQLPRDVADLTGRESEVAEVVTALTPNGETGATPLVTISGKPGVGKSALAVHAAHRLRALYPDGQLYVNLQGATSGLQPLAPLDALSRMLRALSPSSADAPAEVEEAAAQLRSLAAGRRLLVLLDNARSAEQVRPLLPGSQTCAVLVTSRQVLATLEGARRLRLDVLSEERALELLAHIAGPERVAAEPRAAAGVVRACGRLPLAIRIAGVRLVARPGWSIRALAEQLADVTERLELLQAGELAVRASFDVSVRALEESSDPADRAAAAVFGLLSLPDGPELGVEAAAGLLDLTRTATVDLLERLVDAQLLEAPRPDRYRFHDLVRLYAREHVLSGHLEMERTAALTRLMGFYTATAWHTLALLRPHDPRLHEADGRWTAGGLRFPDAREAMSWLELERANLMAAIAQSAQVSLELPGQLARGLFGLFRVCGDWRDCFEANQIALEVAGRLGDRAGQARACHDLAVAYESIGRYDDAVARVRESLAIWHELDDRHAEAGALILLGTFHSRLGQYEEAMARVEESLTICRDIGDRALQADGLNLLGLIHGKLGRYGDAIDWQRESLAIFRALGHRVGQAQCLNNLGQNHGLAGRHDEAISCLQASLGICRELHHTLGQGESLNTLGVVYGQLGRLEEAIESQRASHTIFLRAGSRRGQAVALRDLGDALLASDRTEEAMEAWQEGLAICETGALPQADELRGRLASIEPEPFQLFTSP